MLAIIRTGGKQYRVKPGDVIEVERLKGQEGQQVEFREVLLFDDGSQTLLGRPYLEKAIVRAEVVDQFKDEKVIVFKKKRRKQYKKKRGHRQLKTRVKILEVIPEAGEASEPGLTDKEEVQSAISQERREKEEAIAVSSEKQAEEPKKEARAGRRRSLQKAAHEAESKDEGPKPKRSGGVKKSG